MRKQALRLAVVIVGALVLAACAGGMAKLEKLETGAKEMEKNPQAKEALAGVEKKVGVPGASTAAPAVSGSAKAPAAAASAAAKK
jgi:hypothetical protein